MAKSKFDFTVEGPGGFRKIFFDKDTGVAHVRRKDGTDFEVALEDLPTDRIATLPDSMQAATKFVMSELYCMALEAEDGVKVKPTREELEDEILDNVQARVNAAAEEEARKEAADEEDPAEDI